MTYKEEPGSLFDVPQGYTLVHCISRDCAMGAGIAKEFVKRFPKLKEFCKEVVKNYDFNYADTKVIYSLIITDEPYRVFNLVTKVKYNNKPTYERLHECLVELRNRCDNQTKLAMPRIGCGLDGKDWNKVSAMIQDVFKDTDVEILIRTN